MKVGDLVKWTNPGAESLGIVTKDPKETWGWDSDVVFVVWLDGKHHGEYPIDHDLMELISESR